MKTLLCLFACLVVVLSQNVDEHNLILDYLLNYSGGDYFDHCKVVNEGNGTPAYAVAWRVNANSTVTFGVSAYTLGWIGLGYPLSGANMITSDATISWVDDDTGVATSEDYYLTLRPDDGPNTCPGVCRDTVAPATTDDVTNIAGLQNDTTGVTSIIFSRALSTGDTTKDRILNPNALQRYIAAFHPRDPLVAQHPSRFQFQLNLNAAPTCPNNCTNQGVCMYGCCYCNPGRGGLDCSVVVSTGPSAELTPEFVRDDYPFTFTPKERNDFSIYWVINDDVIEIAIQAKTTGWVALGPTKSPGMVNSDIVIGWIDSNGVPAAADYKITDRQGGCPGICRDDSAAVQGTNDVLAFNGNFADGVTTIKYRKKLNTGDVTGDFEIVDEDMTVVWGFHPDTPGPGIAQHAPNTKGVAKLNFITGSGSSLSKKALQQAHGFLMFFGWAVFIPFGSFIARFLKKYPWWFNVHRVVNGFAMIMTSIAFIIGVYMTPSDTQFTDRHHILGLVITILGTAQPILGILADKMFNPDRTRAPIFPDIIHWILGWSAFLLGFVNIILGMGLYNSPKPLIYVFFIGEGLIILFIGIFTIFRLVKPANDGH